MSPGMTMHPFASTTSSDLNPLGDFSAGPTKVIFPSSAAIAPSWTTLLLSSMVTTVPPLTRSFLDKGLSWRHLGQGFYHVFDVRAEREEQRRLAPCGHVLLDLGPAVVRGP